jgi:hypothetical protein
LRILCALCGKNEHKNAGITFWIMKISTYQNPIIQNWMFEKLEVCLSYCLGLNRFFTSQ